MMNYTDIGFKPADILLPRQVDMKKWSVVACDQYTSQPEYWQRVRRFIGDEPSTLNLMLPEAELDQADPGAINRAMTEYLENQVFRTLEESLVYVKRTLSNGMIRHGLVGALDLECYDYRKGASSLCRATEATVEDRLPPRIRIREGACLEMPHIMVLINDPQFTVIEALDEIRHEFPKLYDFTLMEGGGHLQGYAVNKDQAGQALRGLAVLAGGDENPLLYAVGDGNHSLAAAKACYERCKAELGEAALEHPARYCLVELVNLHCPALVFEPIHRIVFHTDPDRLLAALKKAGLEEGGRNPQKIEIVQKGVRSLWSFARETAKMTVGTLQNALDAYVKETGAGIDYVHGSGVVEDLAGSEDAVGFILPKMNKHDLFPTIVADGALPRKTFSMGNAQDKRFYFECRRIN